MAMAETQLAHRVQNENNDALHRRQLESKIVDATIRSETWGRVCAFTLAMAFLVSATWLIHGRHDGAGGALGVIDIGGLVYVFIHGRQAQRKERGKGTENASGAERSDE
jgi:hypothetical protein